VRSDQKIFWSKRRLTRRAGVLRPRLHTSL
jgi:hypothetical protein